MRNFLAGVIHLGVAGVDARRETPPDPRLPRWGLAGCCPLDPSHPTIVTCEVGREGRHAPRPNDVGGPTTFPGRQTGGDPAASGDLRLGHPWRRASIPPHALTTLLSALGAFGLFEPRVARICLGNLWYICLDNGNASQGADNTSVRAVGVLSVGIPRFLNKSQHFTVQLFRPWRPGSARGSDGGPRRFTEIVPTPHAYSGQWPVKTKRARARSCASVVTRKRPLLNRAGNETPRELCFPCTHSLGLFDQRLDRPAGYVRVVASALKRPRV